MKKLMAVVLSFGLLGSQVAMANYNDIMEQKEREKKRLMNFCGDAPQTFSTLLGGPENYEYYYPTMGPFAAEIESIKPFMHIKENVFSYLQEGAENRHQLIVSRDLNRRLHKYSEKRFREYGWSETANRASEYNERETRENLEYITDKFMASAYEYLFDTTIWVSKQGEPRVQTTGSGFMTKAMERENEKYDPYNAMEVLNSCRAFWTRE